ncbi:hypothetical protein ACJIZ3_016983 [Penstemon smallii]|uniref:SWIM-type domain-containing protein n=1 Tax=Penstemon smallii TaxID=265156 RepID=A0ABD3SUX0_9LAMI
MEHDGDKVNQRQDEKYCSFVHRNESECLKLGMIVYSENEAYELYNRYALEKGFSIRKHQKRYVHGTNQLRERSFVCSKQGFRYDYRELEIIKREQLDTRTGCMACISFKIDKGVWEIVRFNDDHNHDLALPEHRHLLRSGRSIPTATKGVIDSFVNAGIGPTKARSYIAKEMGGVTNITFTSRDCHNYVQSRRLNLIEPTDAQMLINHFKLKQTQDPMFFYTMQLDNENRLTNFFWRDGISKLDGDCFGDVVIFDTTFRTNKYNMVCAPFVGINHHWQNVLLGCAFLLDETTSSFTWVFEAFLEAMGKAPETIFTDQDQAMANAIQKVFPNTCHRLCDWHIFKNAALKIPHLYGKSDFQKKFSKCFYGCDTEEEFELTWKEMIEKWNASENKWLKTLYSLKKKWCPAFSHDFFSANVKSTQRSESMNNVFHRVSRKTLTLTEFVDHYEETTEKQREAETNEDFRSNQGKPHLRVPVGILNHAASLYTCKIFGMFNKEFESAAAENIVEHFSDVTTHFYTLQKEGYRRKHIVQFKPFDFTITCSCKKFEAMGLWCCHIMRILNVNTNTTRIPQQYIVRRWTKRAKEGMTIDRYNEPIQTKAKESKTTRLNKLMRKAFYAMNLAAFDEKTVQMSEESMEHLIQKITDYKRSLDVSDTTNSDSVVQPNDTLSDKITVLNPPSLRPKGETNARIKSRNEKRKRKTTNVAISHKLQSNEIIEGNLNCIHIFTFFLCFYYNLLIILPTMNRTNWAINWHGVL